MSKEFSTSTNLGSDNAIHDKIKQNAISGLTTPDLVTRFKLPEDTVDAYLACCEDDGFILAYRCGKDYYAKAFNGKLERLASKNFVKCQFVTIDEIDTSVKANGCFKTLQVALVGNMFDSLCRGHLVVCPKRIIECLDYSVKIAKKLTQFPRFILVDDEI